MVSGSIAFQADGPVSANSVIGSDLACLRTARGSKQGKTEGDEVGEVMWVGGAAWIRQGLGGHWGDLSLNAV